MRTALLADEVEPSCQVPRDVPAGVPRRYRDGRNAMQYTPVVREIRWTEWSEEHIAEHEVSAAEVEEVVYQKPYLERREGQEVLVYGQTDSGRYLLVVLAPDTEPQETS